MDLEQVVARFPGGKWRGNEFDCKCPAHKDDKPSLSLSESPEGKILLCCQAGCDYRAILAAVGLQPADLNGAAPVNGKRAADSVYTYRDESGEPLFEVVRTPDKQFFQRLPGAEKWGIGETRRVLYELPHLLKSQPGETVAICEGERDCATLRRCGIRATTNPGGASKGRSKWRREFTQWLVEHLPDRKFALFPDNDAVGHEHAEAVRKSLSDAGLTAFIVQMDGLGPKEDITDWASRHTPEEVRALLSQEPPARFRLISFKELLALPPPQPQVERFFDEESFVQVFGQTSHGKSLLMFDLALSIAKGCDQWFGRKILKPGRVVWVNADGGRGLTKRATAWAEANGALRFPFDTLMGAVQLNQSEQVAAFTDQLRRLDPQPVLVVFDTLSRCAVGADENLQSEMTKVTDACHRLKLALGATVCLIHHTDKTGAHDRGSSVVKNETDVQIRVTMDEATKIATVHSCKAREGDHWPDFYFTLQRVRDSVIIVQADSVGDARMRMDRAELNKLRQKVIDLLGSQPGGATLEVLNLQANLEPEDRRIYRILNDLIAERKVIVLDDPAATRTGAGRTPKRYWLAGDPNRDRRVVS